jgi:DNA-binding NarL/FixJ family response regulator
MATACPGIAEPSDRAECEPARRSHRAEPGLIIASGVRLVREGLALSLRGRTAITVLEAVDLSAGSLQLMGELVPDVVLIDVSCPDGLRLAGSIRAVCPAARLVAFSITEVDKDVFACAAAGFCGYVPREGSAEDVYQAVLDAVEGRMRCAPYIAAALFDRVARLMRTHTPAAALPQLTPREREILELVEAGWSNKEIARLLVINGSTVKNHIHSILQKLQVSRRGQAAAMLRAQRAQA